MELQPLDAGFDDPSWKKETLIERKSEKNTETVGRKAHLPPEYAPVMIFTELAC